MIDVSPEIKDYRPNQDILSQLGDYSVLALIGPSGVGKSAVAEQLATSYDKFQKIISHTTRSPLSHEVDGRDYFFETPSDAFFKRFKKDVLEGKFVQVSQHPTTGHLYYSSLESYVRGGVTIIDIRPDAMPAMRRLPLQALHEVMIVAPAAQWHQRFKHKALQWDDDTRHKRIAEGITNLSWGLNQPKITWVENLEGQLQNTADIIKQAIAMALYDSSKARSIGQELLAYLQKLARA